MSNPVPPAQRPGSPPLGTPSRTRYFVVVFAIVLAIIQYIDRVAISQAAPLISRDLGLDKAQMAWVFAAFTMAYAALRDPDRLLGRQDGRPPGPDPRRAVVVVLHRRDRLGLELLVALRGAFPVRRRRGRVLPEHRPRLQPLAAARRARAGAGHPVDVGALGRRRRAAAARPRAAVRELAAGLRAVRRARRHLVRVLVPLVPRQAGRPPARSTPPSSR